MASKKSKLETEIIDGLVEHGVPVVDRNGEAVPHSGGLSFNSSKTCEEAIAAAVDEIARFMPHLRASQEKHAAMSEAAKDAKKSLEGDHLHLAMLCRRLEDAKNGKFQPGLPFADATEDEGAALPIETLTEFGLSDSLIEKISECPASPRTIGELEAFIRADELWHQKIKGLGEAKIEKLIDALTGFRVAYPHPDEDDSEADE